MKVTAARGNRNKTSLEECRAIIGKDDLKCEQDCYFWGRGSKILQPVHI